MTDKEKSIYRDIIHYKTPQKLDRKNPTFGV